MSWGSAKLYFADTGTNYVHATITHSGGSEKSQVVCLPEAEYRIVLCGAGVIAINQSINQSIKINDEKRHLIFSLTFWNF